MNYSKTNVEVDISGCYDNHPSTSAAVLYYRSIWGACRTVTSRQQVWRTAREMELNKHEQALGCLFVCWGEASPSAAAGQTIPVMHLPQ